MPYSEDIEKRIKSFYSIEDIISAMKAYAGVSIRQTEEIVPNVREYEKNILSVMKDLIFFSISSEYGMPKSQRQ